MTLKELQKQFPAAPGYLSQIFFIERDENAVPNARLAQILSVSRPAVSQAIGRLKKLNLVNNNRSETIKLTQKGRSIAEEVVRRHFLMEHLLVKILDYPWDKAEDEATRLQASLSDTLTQHLDERLGHPQTCPHGNPMPHSELEQQYLNAPALHEAKMGSNITIIRITEAGEMVPCMLTFCKNKALLPGKNIVVHEQEEAQTICLDGQKKIEIPRKFAMHIRFFKYVM